MKAVKKVVKAVSAQEVVNAIKGANAAGANLSRAQLLAMIGSVK